MKKKLWFRFNSLVEGILIITALALAGCGGDDGATGAAGAPGADGTDGEPAVALADIVALNPVLDLSNTVSYNAADETLTIHFFLTDGEGNGVDVTTNAYEMRVYVSELVPGDPGSGEGDAWNQLFNERGTPAAGSALPGTLTLVNAATGEYTYTCDNTLPASSNVTRVTVRARWRETIDGTRYVFANPVNTSYDFLQSAPSTELAASGADMVTTAACETCHGARIGDVGHGGGYTQVKTCNHCHNANYMTVANGLSPDADLAHMVHRIHDAGMFDDLDHGDPADFSHVTYPQHIYACAKCHTGEAPNAEVAFNVPTRKNCGSCHADTVFDMDGLAHSHSGGVQADDSNCDTCHVPGGTGGALAIPGTEHTSITALNPLHFDFDAGDVINDPDNVSEFAVTITMDPPDNGTHYIAGVDTPPLITVTLADYETGDPVPSAFYTDPASADGVSPDGAGNGLTATNLYVYGPRADAVPVLTTNSTTDGGTQQAHALFTGGTDTQVETNGDGFKYRLLDHFDQLEPGTYIVRFEGEGYGAVDADDYHTASSTVITFQVGTAEEEHKVSGDACTNCHGDTIMHLEGAHPHHAPFDTDHCLGCHDLSGNYADYIGNRVHAVHRASVTGDLHLTGGLPRDWSEVTFPQEPNNCRICHTDTTAATPVWRNPNEVACGGCHGTDVDATTAKYPDADPDRIAQEAAAAVHMENMGGTFDATTLDVTRQCIVCHGEGRVADLYETHDLINFPVSEDEDPVD